MCDKCTDNNFYEIGEVMRNLFSLSADWGPESSAWDSYFISSGKTLVESYYHGVQRPYGEQAPAGVKGFMYQIPHWGAMSPLWQIEILGAIKNLDKGN